MPASVGDIVALLQLAWQIRAALRDAAGTRTEIDTLVEDVDSFIRALQQIESFIEHRSTALDPAVANGINHAVTACTDALGQVVSRISAFRGKMTSKGTIKWKQYWKIAAWSVLGGREEVDRLRRRLSEQVHAVHTFLFLSHAADLAALSRADLAALSRAVEQQGETLREMCDRRSGIYVLSSQTPTPNIVWDPIDERYYYAYARTSLSRLQELHRRGSQHPEGPFIMHLDGRSGELWAADNSPVPNLHSAHIAFWLPERTVIILSCVFWRAHPNDNWQILLGLPGPMQCVFGREDGLRLFLERKKLHKPAFDCQCRPACRDLLAGLPNVARLSALIGVSAKDRLEQFYERNVVCSARCTYLD